MMMAAVGSRWNVTGKSSATAVSEPIPGMTPNAVPSRTPRKQ